MPRLDGVDVLRGLSILAVILLHIWIRFAGEGFKMGRAWPPMWSSLVWFNGGNGVTIFFAVSGFLITLTSLRRFGSLGAVRPAVFYRIRFARIMPLLLLLLLALSILHLTRVDGFIVNKKHFTLPRALVSALLFHLNWLEASRDAWLPACWTVLWSLSIEEMFYLFFPLVSAALFSKALRRRVPVGPAIWIVLAIAFVAMGPFARTVWSHTDLQQENSYLAGMSNIAFGCLTALSVHSAIKRGWWLNTLKQRRIFFCMQMCGWLLIAFFATWPRWAWVRPLSKAIGRSGVDDTLLALATCLVIASIFLRGARGRKWSAPLRWFGRHSYELYLWHEFVVIAGVHAYMKFYPKGSSRGVLVSFVITIVALTAPLAWALARWFSEPLNRTLRGAPLPTQRTSN